eukprot:4290943-Alexandrium_andersonii.AAC.1
MGWAGRAGRCGCVGWAGRARLAARPGLAGRVADRKRRAAWSHEPDRLRAGMPLGAVAYAACPAFVRVPRLSFRFE